MSDEIHKIYSNGEISVLWRAEMCQHTGICFLGLPGVFDPRRRPWIVLENATSDEIVEQVSKCPSRALSIVKWKE
jgi:uncharacterized Fe-S cluster protein YjdI